MTQLEDDRKTPEMQDGSRQGRRRLCLLKGCERTFHPAHPLSRYCSAECKAAARRWRQRTANRDYRSSPQGKERRREQSRRYRTRIGQRKAAENTPREGCEGYPYAPPEKFFCQRPGCYEHVLPTARSPRQRFCSWACRNALRRVVVRERRWRRRLGLPTLARCQRDDFW